MGKENLRVPANRDIKVGETIVLGFRHKVNLGVQYGYEWEVTDGNDDWLLYESTDEIDDKIAHGARVNTFRPEEPGTYTIEATRKTNKDVAPLSPNKKTINRTKTITVEEDHDYFQGKSRKDLLEEYAPKINFHPDEEFYPTRYEAYVDNSQVVSSRIDRQGASLFDLYYKQNRGDPHLNPETGSAQSHVSYQDNVVEDDYPKTIYGNVSSGIRYGQHTYKAVSYWMFYINDPKPDTASPTSEIAAKHTGDQEGVVILVNDSGPQYVATHQHYGGEIRAWDDIKKDGSHPELYVGQGSHPTFFGPSHPNERPAGSDGWDEDSEVQYRYQQQYLCKANGGPGFFIVDICEADDAGEPELPNFGSRYVDPVQDGETWEPSDYETTLLTSKEAWSQYDGDIYRYSRALDLAGGRFRGSFLTNAGRLSQAYLEKFTDKDSGDQREAWPTASQVDGIITANADGSQQAGSYDASGDPVSVGVTVYNTKFHPHEFVVGQRGKPTTQRRVFVERPRIEHIGIEDEPTHDPNSARTPNPSYTIAEIPVVADGGGQVELRLSVFGDDNELDTTTVDLEGTEPVDADIITEDAAAGNNDDPQTVGQTVELTRDGLPYQGPRPTFDLTVGGKPVRNHLIIPDGEGSYQLIYQPPTQNESGAYNLTISLKDGPTLINETDAIIYSNETGVQVAANLQIDRSGSMDDVIDEAKEGGATFVEQSSDDDYTSVVSYANTARTEQSLVELSEGRSDVIDAIEGISAFGGTNIGGSLEQGLSSLDGAPDGTTKAAILMTDGIRNDGPSEQEILEDIVPRYNDQGVCLYTIGFGAGADEELLQDIADAADCGEYRFAGQESEVDSINQTLQSVYQDLGGEVSDDETITSESGTFGGNLTGQFTVGDAAELKIDAVTDVVDVSLAPGPDEPRANIQLAPSPSGQSDEIRLMRPDGTVLNTSDKNVSKSVVGDRIIYRIDDPQPGEWTYELRNTQSDDAQYSVDVSAEARTKLDVSASAETYSPGSTASVTATLFGSDGGVGNATVEGTATLPDGNTTDVSFDGRKPGVYDGTIAPEQAGEYTVEVTATKQNASLDRQATTTFTVDDTPPLSISQSDTPEIVSGARETFELDVDGNTDAKYSLELSAFEAVNGTATIPSDDAWLWNDSVSPQASVNVTAAVGRSTPAGTYEATLEAYDIDTDTVVTEEITIEVVDPATFDVELTETNAPVEGGDALNSTALVTNTGDVAGSQNVSFSLYGVGSDTTELSLGSGESTTVEFSVPTTVAENGTRYAVVGSRTDRNATRVDVLGPAYFVAGMSEQSVIPGNGSKMTLRAAAINRGDETATQELTLSDANGTVATQTVTLDQEEVRRVNFTYSTDAAAVGENLTLTSANTTSNTTLITRAMSYADSDGVIDSRGLDIAVLDWKDGEIGRDVLDRVTEYWASGEEVY